MKKNENNSLEKYKNDITKILKIPPERIHSLEKVPWLNKMEEGTKSRVYELIAYPESKSVQSSFILKEYDLDSLDMGGNDIFKEYVTEKAILKIAKEYKIGSMFPVILSENYEPFEEKKAILVKTVSDKTLEQLLTPLNFRGTYHEKLEKKNKMIRSSLDISARFDTIISKYKDKIENEISNLSNKKFREGIESRENNRYVSNFKRYFQTFFSRQIDSDYLSELASEYWKDRSIIVEDCYPFNLAPETFIDLGKIKIGPTALQLGCLLGYPSVFNIIRKEGGGENCFHPFVSYFSKNKGKTETEDKDTENLAVGTMLGGIYGNMRIAAGLKLRKGDSYSRHITRFLLSAREQAKMLEKEKKIQPLYSLINGSLIKSLDR